MRLGAGREPPEDLMRDLKAILPTVELLNVQEDFWWLLDLTRRPERIQRGKEIKRREYARLKEGKSVRLPLVRMTELMMEGYELIGRYNWTGDAPRALLIHDLQMKQRATEAEMEAAERARVAEASEDYESRAARNTEEFIDAEGKSLFAITVKGRKHFVQPGA